MEASITDSKEEDQNVQLRDQKLIPDLIEQRHVLSLHTNIITEVDFPTQVPSHPISTLPAKRPNPCSSPL
jgi:hypothetical protein